MALGTKRLKYLDLTNYLAAGTSLQAFYKAYNVTDSKGFFCYEWFDSLEKLNWPNLPPQEEFYSTLDNKNISEKDCKHSGLERKKDGARGTFSLINSEIIGTVQCKSFTLASLTDRYEKNG